MPNEGIPDQSFTKIDVPADGSCLFWAVTLAYLTPVKNDDALFQQRYEALFGNEETVTQNLDHIRNMVQNYDMYDGTFVGLVRNTFRNRVVDYMRSHESDFKAFAEGESGKSFNVYLREMRSPNEWGGEPEIRAMSRMLGADISVSGASNTRYDNGDVQIQLFHVVTSGIRNHYNFGLEQHIVNNNEVELLQNSLKKSIEHYQGGPQDFELIQLLIQEADSVKGADASTSTQQREDFESFQARFQSYIDQIPSYLHSVKKPGFFSHFFLGSFSTLLDTEIAEKLNIKKIYFSFDTAGTLKVVVVKNGQIGNVEDAVKNINLFSISEGKRGHQFTIDELEKILRENIDKSKIKDQDVEGEIQNIKDEIQDRMKSRLVQISKGKDGVFVETEVKEMLDSAASCEFHEIEKGLWDNPEGDILQLSSSKKEDVKRSLREILNAINVVHSKYEDSLQYDNKAREAAHHGFIAGALNNFRYRYNLRVYLEQFAGRGYADIVLLVRGPGRALDSIPVIMEIKVATAQEIKRLKKLKELEESRGLTENEERERSKIKEKIEARSVAALEQQAKNYAQGFQPNVQRVLTIADDILYVVVNFDSPSPISNIEAVSRNGRIIPLFEDMLKSTDDWYNDAEEVGKRELKKQIKDNLERIYHTFPGTGEKGDNHYFSRFLLGQSLLLNKALGAKFEKRIFIYDKDEHIPTEIHPESGRPQRPTARKTKSKLSTGLDSSHAVVSMVLIPESTEKLVYVINIVEANRKDVLNKALPLDRLSQKIEGRKIVELNLNFDTRHKLNFERYLTVEASDPVSLEQYNEREIFQGTFKEVPYSDQLKETFDRALDSQLTSAQLSPIIDAYEKLSKKIGEGVWPFKTLIGKETDFQGVLHGVFSHYSDLKLQESPETRALVLTEFQTGGGERIDMVVHALKFKGDDGNAKEYILVGFEFKTSRQGKGAEALLKEAIEQIKEKYREGVTYKTLKDGDEVIFIAFVFNKGARDADSLILVSKELITAKVVHSSTHVLPKVEGLRTLESATAKEDYHYWLQQHDIADVARIEYGYGTDRADTLFEIVGSPGQIASQLQQFQNSVATEGERRPLTLVVNLGNIHWVTLVIAYQNERYTGYYVDSKGDSIPDNIRQVLEQAQITFHDASVTQQTDGHNCGLWALENARDINAVLRENRSRDITIGDIRNHLQVRGRDEDYFLRLREDISDKLSIDPQRIANLETILAEIQQPVGQCSKERKKRNIGMACVDSRDEENITKEEKERRIKELLSDEMIMKIKLKELESKINDEVLSRHEEIESAATYDVNKSDVLSNALQSLKLSKMLLLMSQESEISIELQEKAYYNALIDLGALIHDHKNHVHGDHLSALENRVQGNQLFSVAHDLYYLSKSRGNVDQDKLYSDQVKSKINSYVEGKNRLDDIYGEFNIIDIKGCFSDSDVKDFYIEAEAYDKEVITIHSTQVFADEAKVYVRVKDSNDDVMIGDIASIQNTENYILDEETSEIKLRVDDDKEYTTTQELEEGHVKHYLNILGGHKVKIGNIISSFTGDIKEAIHSKLYKLELLASKKDVEEISNAEITDQDYNDIVDEIKQSLLQKGVSEGTFNQLKDHLDNLGEKVFAEYISDVEKKLEGHGIKFDRNKFDSAKVKGAKGGKFFSFMAIYDLFDSISDVSTLGRHDNDALKKIFGINGILDAMDDVRESLSVSYIRSDGKVITKISRDSIMGKVISKVPDHIRKTFVKIINNPVVQGITFATIAYQFGYSMNEIVKGNHHPLNYYWTASSGIKLASMSIKPISIGVSSAMKGISATTKVLRGLSAASKVLGKAAIVTMVADVLITIGVEIHERMEHTKAMAEQVPLLPGNEQAEVFFAKVIKAFTGRDIEKEYEDIIRIKGYLNYIKGEAIKLLGNDSIAAVVWFMSRIEEKYDEIIKITDVVRNTLLSTEKERCDVENKYKGVSFVVPFPYARGNLFSLNVSEASPMILASLYMKGWAEFECFFSRQGSECMENLTDVYVIDTNAKHIPHLTTHEYQNLGLRIMSAPLEHPTEERQCGDLMNQKDRITDYGMGKKCNVGLIYRNCTNFFTFSDTPFIFVNSRRNGPILYMSGPQDLEAAANYPAVIYVPEGEVNYTGSENHNNTFIVNYHTYGRVRGGTAGNTIVMNYNTSEIFVELNNRAIEMEGSRVHLSYIYDYISHSTANQYISTNCKTRYVNAGEGGGNNRILSHNVDCQDEDYEIRKVNKKDTHRRGMKQTTFIVDKNSGSGASIISYHNLKSKKNLDTIFVKNIDIVQLKINEHQADYSLELLTDDKRSTVTSTKIDSFENLVIQVEHYGITKTITVQDKSLPDVIKDIEYQKLNHSGIDVDSKVMENSKKRSKAVILANIASSEDLTAYEVAKDIINNNNLGIPISLVQVKKIMANVVYEAIVKSMYPNEVVADFSYGSINCKKVIIIQMEGHESKCVVKFPQACDRPIDFVLRVINNPMLYASTSDQIVDLTECNINPANVECRADDEYATGIILNSRVNQGSFQVVLDSYLRGPEYQHIVLQFNKGGEFYKVSSMNLKLKPVLLYEEKIVVDYDSVMYYKPNEQGLQVYHNQPNNENKIGFIDLGDKSIFDSNMEIIDGSLVLLHNNNTFTEIKNWKTNRPTRKMMFAFNETTISDLECLFPTCDPEGIVQKFREKKEILLEAELFDAARQGDLDVVKSLVRRGVNVNAQGDFGRNLIFYSAWSGDLVEYLVTEGVDIDAKDNTGHTPIWHYSCSGSLRAVKNLVENSADINIKDSINRTSVWCASQGGHLKVVEYLVCEGAGIHAKDKYGYKLQDVARTNVVTYLNLERSVQLERCHHHGDHPRHHSGGQKYLQREERSVHLELEGTSCSIESDNSVIENDQATSGANKPFSLMAGLMNMIVGTLRNAFQFISSSFKSDNGSQFKETQTRSSREHHSVSQSNLENIASLATTVSNPVNTIVSREKGGELVLNVINDGLHKSATEKSEGSKFNSTQADSKQSERTFSATLPNISQSGKSPVQGIPQENISNTDGSFSRKKAEGSSNPGAASPEGTSSTTSSISQVYAQPDINGLLLVPISMNIMGKKFIFPLFSAEQPIPSSEVWAYALNIINGFKEVLEQQAALKDGIAVERFKPKIDGVKMQEEIIGKIMSGKFNEISGVLKSHVEKALPGRETGDPGRLSKKKFDKFMTEFNSRIDPVIDQSMQQTLSRLEISNVKEQQISLEPKSYLSDTSVQGHLTQDRGLRN